MEDEDREAWGFLSVSVLFIWVFPCIIRVKMCTRKTNIHLHFFSVVTVMTSENKPAALSSLWKGNAEKTWTRWRKNEVKSRWWDTTKYTEYMLGMRMWCWCEYGNPERQMTTFFGDPFYKYTFSPLKTGITYFFAC